jgi:hypothetical protein
MKNAAEAKRNLVTFCRKIFYNPKIRPYVVVEYPFHLVSYREEQGNGVVAFCRRLKLGEKANGRRFFTKRGALRATRLRRPGEKKIIKSVVNDGKIFLVYVFCR